MLWNFLAPCTYLTSSPSTILHSCFSNTMPQPSIPCWISTRSQNTVAHPWAVDISVKEVGEGHLPKTLLPQKKKTRQTKNQKSAEETEAGIQQVAAHKKQSLHNELVNGTPQAVVTPTIPCKSSEPGDHSKFEGGNVYNNVPHAETGMGVGDLPFPVTNVHPGPKEI